MNLASLSTGRPAPKFSRFEFSPFFPHRLPPTNTGGSKPPPPLQPSWPRRSNVKLYKLFIDTHSCWHGGTAPNATALVELPRMWWAWIIILRSRFRFGSFPFFQSSVAQPRDGAAAKNLLLKHNLATFNTWTSYPTTVSQSASVESSAS